MIEHMARAFDADLQELGLKVAEMGRLAVKQLADAFEALETRDIALARSVIAADDQIDALQRQIEEKGVVTIVRRQPMAVDLREIVGALRTSNDLERVGDLAENVAARVALVAEEPHFDEVMPRLRHMQQLVLARLKTVLDGYLRHDVAEALNVWRADVEVDALNNSLFREMLARMAEDPRKIPLCTHLLFCAKNIERIGDHATNIAETIHYIVEGHPLPEKRPKADLSMQIS